MLQPDIDDDTKPIECTEKFFPNVGPVKSIPQHFWKIDQFDLINVALMGLFIVLNWIISFTSGDSLSVLSYWDGPNYIYAGICLYNVPEDNLWTIYYKYPPSYFSCHLPGFPLAIRLCSLFVLNFFAFGAHLTIFVISCLLIFVFRRTLMIYNCVADPAFTASLLIIFPLRFTIYHTVAASEPLFLLYVCFSFIFFKTNQMLPLFLSIFGACITRIEGLAIFGTIGLCYLFRLDIIRAFIVGLAISAPISLLLLHYIKFNDIFAYIHFNQNHQGLIRFPPFHEIRGQFQGNNIVYLDSSLYLFLPFILGTIMLYFISVPFAIFSTVYVIYVSLLFHLDIFRYSLPGFIFAILVGFDSIISTPPFKRAIIILLPFYVAFLLYMIPNQIQSNRAPDWFTRNVLHSKVSYY